PPRAVGLPGHLLADRLTGGEILGAGPLTRAHMHQRQELSCPPLGQQRPLLGARVAVEESPDAGRWVRPVEVQAHARHDRRFRALHQDPADFASRPQDVVGPFQAHRFPQDPAGGDAGDERDPRHRWLRPVGHEPDRHRDPRGAVIHRAPDLPRPWLWRWATTTAGRPGRAPARARSWVDGTTSCTSSEYGVSTPPPGESNIVETWVRKRASNNSASCGKRDSTTVASGP